VIVDGSTLPEKLHWQDGFGAYRSKRDADIFPMRAEDFERNRAVVNTLAAAADADGIVVYGSPKGSCMKAPDPGARWEAVNHWLEVAQVESIANNAEIDVIWEKWQQTLEPLRDRLNAALGRGAYHTVIPGRGSAASPEPMNTGAENDAPTVGTDTARSVVMGSGPGPAGRPGMTEEWGLEEWQIPREAGRTGRTRQKAYTPSGGQRGLRDRRRSTPRSTPRRSSNISTTSLAPTIRGPASPARSRSRACRRIG
jgi:hypothetical protein